MLIGQLALSFFNLIINILSRFPDSNNAILESTLEYVDMLNYLITRADVLFPMDVLFLIFGIILTIEILMLSVNGIIFLYKLLPFT